MDDTRVPSPETGSDDEAPTSCAAGHAVSTNIPDRYLYQAFGACCTDGENGRFFLTKPVRELIARYAPNDRPTANAIPQDRRVEFLLELSSITGRALPTYKPVPAEPVLAGQDATPIDSSSEPFGPEFISTDQDVTPIVNGPAPILTNPSLALNDVALIVNGYEPIPTKGKIPVAKGWRTRLMTMEAVFAERARYPGALNTGLRTGRLVGVDIDIIPADHVEAIKHLATAVLGHTLHERIGAKGAMLCYRNETPISKITVSGSHPNHSGKIEILGLGQQFVAYGIHPDIERPYTWINALRDAEPLRTPLDKLPEVTPEKLRDFAEQAAKLMAGLGYAGAKVSGNGEATERVVLDGPVDVEFDTPLSIERSRNWLRDLIARGDVAIEGKGGDTRTYLVATILRDFGLSAKTAWEMLLEPGGWNEHCDPPWEPKELAVKVRNAYKYAKNPPGEYAASFSPIELPEPGTVAATPSRSVDKRAGRFCGMWPDEYEALPELTFWDTDKTLPRCPGGCIAIVYGEFGSHKTNTVLTMALDAVLGQDARVCYAAGEGAHGVGKQRIPAHCVARGITTKDLRDRLRIVPAVPLFASSDEVVEFIEAQKDFHPDIVVIDTLATAIAGEDENSSTAAAFLTANGPAGRIRDAFNALVIFPAHQGKDAAKKVRGHSGFMGNADVVLHVDADKRTGAIKVTVEKMRDNRDGFSIFFKVPPAGFDIVPVPEKITEEQYRGLGATSVPTSEAERTFSLRRGLLFQEGAVSFDLGLSERRFAEILSGPPPSDDDAEAQATWKTQVERERVSLKNAHDKKSYKGVFCDQRVPTGSDKMEWRWFIVKPGG